MVKKRILNDFERAAQRFSDELENKFKKLDKRLDRLEKEIEDLKKK